TDADVAVTTGMYQGPRRRTLTYPMLNRPRRILWLVTRADKAGGPPPLPARAAAVPAGPNPQCPGPAPRPRARPAPRAAPRRLTCLSDGNKPPGGFHSRRVARSTTPSAAGRIR